MQSTNEDVQTMLSVQNLSWLQCSRLHPHICFWVQMQHIIAHTFCLLKAVARIWRAGVDNTETNRRDWRELLYTAPDLGKYISGAIMFEETLYQSCADGKPFVDVLRDQGIMPGIKVDGGLEASHMPHAKCRIVCHEA